MDTDGKSVTRTRAVDGRNQEIGTKQRFTRKYAITKACMCAHVCIHSLPPSLPPPSAAVSIVMPEAERE